MINDINMNTFNIFLNINFCNKKSKEEILFDIHKFLINVFNREEQIVNKEENSSLENIILLEKKKYLLT